MGMETILIIVGIVIGLIVLIFALGYLKAPPDTAYIISGLSTKKRILIGKAGFRVPFFERVDRLSLGVMQVDVKTSEAVPTNEFINVNVDAVAKIQVIPDIDGVRLAAKNFLNKRPEDIARDLQDSLQGNMREIIGTLSLKEINTDRDSFSDQVMMKAAKDMDKLGAKICSSREEALDGADVVMGLRIQLERQQAGNFPSLGEYASNYGVGEKELAFAKPNAIVLHPGPVNRNVELTSQVIDHERSHIEDQVLSGVAVRMALLYLLNEYRESDK